MEIGDRSGAWLVGRAPINLLAGAGVSAGAPSALPGWWTLNTEVVASLARRLEEISGSEEEARAFQATIRLRRDSTKALQPDLQAQVIEDEIGPAYFRALASVDSPEINATHAGVAELAARGRLRAIITTNFDTLIEQSLQEAGVPFRCFAAPDEFDELGQQQDALTVVKVHGTAIRPTTMVDTLRQRLQGRPQSLLAWLRECFLTAPTLSLGFSGQDLGYRNDYLAMRPSIEEGATFGFLVRTGEEPARPLQELIALAPERVIRFDGELPTWLRTSGLTAADSPAFPPADETSARESALARLRAALTAWAAGLENLEVINAVTSLYTAAGRRERANAILERACANHAWRLEASPAAMARVGHNYGELLFRRGNFLTSDRELHPQRWFFMSNRLAPSTHYKCHDLLCRFLKGERIHVHNENTNQSLAEETAGCADALWDRMGTDRGPMHATDTAFVLSELLEFLALGQMATRFLEAAHETSILSGDEFRRAEAAWRLARNLAFGLATGDSERERADSRERVQELVEECVGISRRLDIREADAGAWMARSIRDNQLARWDTGDRAAEEARRLYARLGHRYGVFQTVRERLRAWIGAAGVARSAEGKPFDRMSLYLQLYVRNRAPGLKPLVFLELALCAQHFDVPLARGFAEDAAQTGDSQGHPWIPDSARMLLSRLTSTPDSDT